MNRNPLANAVISALDGAVAPWWPQIVAAQDGLLYPYYTVGATRWPESVLLRFIDGHTNLEVREFNLFTCPPNHWWSHQP